MSFIQHITDHLLTRSGLLSKEETYQECDDYGVGHTIRTARATGVGGVPEPFWKTRTLHGDTCTAAALLQALPGRLTKIARLVFSVDIDGPLKG